MIKKKLYLCVVSYIIFSLFLFCSCEVRKIKQSDNEIQDSEIVEDDNKGNDEDSDCESAIQITVLSSIKFKRNEYTLFLHENSEGDLFDLQGEIVFSQDAPEGKPWEYDVYESDVSGNPASNRKLIISRRMVGEKTVITMGPVQGGAAGSTYITVKDVAANGYGVMHTVPVKVRNTVYADGNKALEVKADGKTNVSAYQGETVDFTVTYKLRNYENKDVKLDADNLTTELYFYYSSNAYEPGESGFTNAPKYITLSKMSYMGELGSDPEKTKIYSVSPTGITISADGKTATATVSAKIGGTAPSGSVGISFVTFPQSSHYDPEVLNSAIIGEGDGVYIVAEPVYVNVLETVSKR